ncbi:MAG TPA: magnesium/cobalt transporter CorA [Thermoleophilia bacterium]|nr:magnesium/cobalt transporter CorA [Thermoleophilia bacterium]
MSVRVRVFRDGRPAEADLPLQRVSEVLEEPDTLVWLDMATPAPDEVERLGEEFGLHPLALEDALHEHQRPKIDRYPDFAFVTAYAAEWSDGDRIVLHEVGMFVASRYVITVRHDEGFDLSDVGERLTHAPADLARRGAFVGYTVLDHIVDGYFVVTDRLQERLEDVEEHLVWATRKGDQIGEAYRLRRDLIYFRRVVAPLREVMHALARRDEPAFDEPIHEYFRDLYDHVVRVFEEIEMDRDIIAAAFEDHLAVVSNRLNMVVLKVSAWAAIIALPTVIASIYGMNFTHMPELGWRYGYPYALGVMAAAAGILYVTFKRKGWL